MQKKRKLSVFIYIHGILSCEFYLFNMQKIVLKICVVETTVGYNVRICIKEIEYFLV